MTIDQAVRRVIDRVWPPDNRVPASHPYWQEFTRQVKAGEQAWFVRDVRAEMKAT